MTQDTITSLFTNSLSGGDWLPSVYNNAQVSASVTDYEIEIPRLKITNAAVSTVDTQLDKHLVHFPGTALPPDQGNAVIFGHSTLPQLYKKNDYKTIFANIHNMTVGDKIIVTINDKKYTYLVSNITIVDADDTSYLSQDQNKNLLTIVTCTPPGTIWKRLLVTARLDSK